MIFSGLSDRSENKNSTAIIVIVMIIIILKGNKGDFLLLLRVNAYGLFMLE